MAALSGAPPSEPASGLLRRMVAELHSAAPGDAQPLLRPLRSSLALRLRHQCHDPDGQVVCLRQVDRGELHAAVAQRQQEGGVLREPIELGDDQCRAGDPGSSVFPRSCRNGYLSALHLQAGRLRELATLASLRRVQGQVSDFTYVASWSGFV